MNILVLSHMYPNDFNINSGIFIHKQIKALKSLYGENLNVKVISPIPYAPKLLSLISNKYKKYYNIPKSIIYEGIEVFYPRIFLLPKNLNFKSSGKTMYYGIKSLVDSIYKDFKFDLIHAHVALPDGECAIKLNEKFGKSIVTTIHGQDMNYTVTLGEEYKNKVIKVLENSTEVIFVSNKLKREAEKYTSKNNNFKVIPNGISIEDIVKTNNKRIDEEFENSSYILLVGNLIKTKGIDYAIDAFSQFHKKYDNLKLVIIGAGLERENLEKMCKDRKVLHKVIFKGALSHDKVMEYMKNCLFFVLPSYKEGFGVVYIEAMAHGKAVIGCEGEGIADVIENKVNGILVKPKDLEDLRSNMELLIKNDKLRNEIGLNAEKQILSSYTWENNATLNYNLYNKLINKSYGGK